MNLNELIKKCEDNSLLYNETFFILLDSEERLIVDKNSKSSQRNSKIYSVFMQTYDVNDSIDGLFIMGDHEYVSKFPSRKIIYDTETKILDEYNRYDYVYNYIKSYNFIPSEWNLGREYEQCFTLKNNDCIYTIRLGSNLTLKVEGKFILNGYISEFKKIYNGYFKKSVIDSCVINEYYN